jgi:hypothetical protein
LGAAGRFGFMGQGCSLPTGVLPSVTRQPDHLTALLDGLVARIIDGVLEGIATTVQPEPQHPPPLLDRQALARALTVSLPTVDRLRREEGMPTIWVLESPRFDLREVLEWLRKQKAEQPSEIRAKYLDVEPESEGEAEGEDACKSAG